MNGNIRSHSIILKQYLNRNLVKQLRKNNFALPTTIEMWQKMATSWDRAAQEIITTYCFSYQNTADQMQKHMISLEIP